MENGLVFNPYSETLSPYAPARDAVVPLARDVTEKCRALQLIPEPIYTHRRDNTGRSVVVTCEVAAVTYADPSEAATPLVGDGIHSVSLAVTPQVCVNPAGKRTTLMRTCFEDMWFMPARGRDSADEARVFLIFIGQIPLEMLRNERTQRLKRLINWAAGHEVVVGEIDVHDESKKKDLRATQAALARAILHTGCATATVLTSASVLLQILLALNERTFMTDLDSVWITRDAIEVPKEAAHQLQAVVGGDRMAFRPQRLVFQQAKSMPRAVVHNSGGAARATHLNRRTH